MCGWFQCAGIRNGGAPIWFDSHSLRAAIALVFAPVGAYAVARRLHRGQIALRQHAPHIGP